MNRLIPGIVSVTFRALSPAEIIGLSVQAGISLVEWGGDVHVPHGDTNTARDVGEQTRDAGLEVACYGSYYRVGVAGSPDFEACRDTAAALGAPVIRVWAGNLGSADADQDAFERVADDTRRICRIAGQAGLAVAFEYHGGTLTDKLDSALRLLKSAASPNLRTLWQPLGSESPATYAEQIPSLAPWLAHAHVYNWPGGVHAPLADGEQAWREPIEALAQIDRPVGLLLEFVRGNSAEQFLADAATLRRWIEE